MKEKLIHAVREKIIFSKTNPRNPQDYKDDDLKSLGKSIAENGLIQPVRVRKHPEKKGFLELIIGERRVRAHKFAGIPKVLAIFCDYTDNQCVIAQNIENLQRKDVHALDEARSLKSLLDLVNEKTGKPEFTVDSLSKEIGMSKSYIWETIILVNLSEEFQKLFREKSITKKIAMMFARQTPDQQTELLKWYQDKIEYDSVEEGDVKDHLEHNYHLVLAGAPFNVNDADLIPEAGSCTACAKRTGNNPDLFGDVGKKDTCTDSKCFNIKKEAVFDRNFSKLSQTDESFVMITDEYHSRKKDILVESEWKPAKKSDRGAVPAIYVDGKQQGAVVYVKPDRIPMDEESKPKKKSKQKPGKKELSYEERQAIEKEMRAAAYKRLIPIAAELVKHVPEKLTKDHIESLARFVVKQVNGFSDLTRALSETPDTYPGDKKKWDQMQNLFNNEQILALGALLIQYDFDVSYSTNKISKETFQLCDALKVKYKPILQKITDEEKAEKKLEKEKQKKEKIADDSSISTTGH